MQTEFNYIVDLSKKLTEYFENDDKLFSAINSLSKNELQDIFNEYGDPDNNFQPVNLLRAEIARLRLSELNITEKVVEDVKNHIRHKDISYFESYSASFLSSFKDYKETVGKGDYFTAWNKHYRVFFVYFYRGKVKETTKIYLDKIGNQLQSDLNLSAYIVHPVDFFGPANFGSKQSWIALYPDIKNNHRDSYQFFLRLAAVPEAGMMAGHSIQNPIEGKLKKIHNYEDALSQLKLLKEEILKLNKESRNYFKFAPGSQASQWQRFYESETIGVDFDIEDLSIYDSREEISLALGLPEDSLSNKSWNLWLFKSANIDDIVFASKGTNTCLGIGVIKGLYTYVPEIDDFRHIRKVEWITDKVYHYKSKSFKTNKNLFRIDTFSPTKIWDFLLKEYVRLFPELIPIFKKHDLFTSEEPNTKAYKQKDEDDTDSLVEEGDSTEYWWINANPKIWSISSHKEGQLQTYTTHNEKGNKRRIYKYFEAIKPGDIILGYESSPTKQIKAVYEVTKGIHNTSDGEKIEFELIEKLEIPIHWNELKNNPSLQKCEVLINNQGSLFKLTEEEYDIISEIIDNKNILTELHVKSTEIKKYKYATDPDKPFIKESDFHQTVSILKRKKNIILQGPPGVGKTFIAKKLAYEIMQEVQDANIEMVQFHQSFSYEDFIQGLRPTLKGGFDIKDGIFYSFCQRALAHPDRSFFFIIDEINRGNLSKIYGELLMLLEADKRSEKFAVKLTYAQDEDDRFYVPDNLYIIGTMNTADRSLAIVDYALRRRFAFISLKPDFGDTFRSFLKGNGVSNSLLDHICSSISKVNSKIREDINLGEGYQIGHSYFCGLDSNSDENLLWEEILLYEIKPLLEELWFDDLSKVSDSMKLLSRT